MEPLLVSRVLICFVNTTSSINKYREEKDKQHKQKMRQTPPFWRILFCSSRASAYLADTIFNAPASASSTFFTRGTPRT